ncbi:MAG: efflux RND transporter periplasmic adaptor subunit [Rickettsiales bacterium]|nr:efflux RND transporter periplasmic adaptor subunit [Rickettsiales bacterium]
MIKILFSNKNNTKFNIKHFDVETITRGNVKKIVSATGTINPINVISVGSRVSGTIEKIYVDYNDKVKKGQKLAVLDVDALKNELNEYKSYLAQKKSQLKYVELNTKRTRELYKNKYIAKAELDQAETELVEAKENYNVAKLRYEKSKINLNYAYINSPVAGTVISRNVDEGQTVAASFSTPTLFTIAEDLSKMQIETSISEADIGLIKNNKGLKISFTVDAYKDKIFEGNIRQIRLNSTMESNVVVYNVIIDIDNNEELLLPGMTAYVSIVIDSVENVLRIPNTTLRFKATKEIRQAMGMDEMTQKEKDQLSNKYSEGNFAYIYVLENGKPKAILVEKGISDITYTEIKSNEIREGMTVLSAYIK